MTERVQEPRAGSEAVSQVSAKDDGGTGDADVVAARRLLAAHGRQVRDQQLAAAGAELDLTEDERAEIERLADRLVERLLARPRQSLRTAPDRERVAATVSDLFE